MTEKHDAIGRRAYEIWEREGRPNGRDREHWFQAERELDSEESTSRTRQEDIEASRELSDTAAQSAREQRQVRNHEKLPADLTDIVGELRALSPGIKLEAKRKWGQIPDDRFEELENNRDWVACLLQLSHGMTQDEAEREIVPWIVRVG